MMVLEARRLRISASDWGLSPRVVEYTTQDQRPQPRSPWSFFFIRIICKSFVLLRRLASSALTHAAQSHQHQCMDGTRTVLKMFLEGRLCGTLSSVQDQPRCTWTEEGCRNKMAAFLFKSIALFLMLDSGSDACASKRKSLSGTFGDVFVFIFTSRMSIARAQP